MASTSTGPMRGTGNIGEATLDGTVIAPQLVSGLSVPVGIAVDAHHVYWADLGSNAIGKANLDGSAATDTFITNVINASGVAIAQAGAAGLPQRSGGLPVHAAGHPRRRRR